jgi:hypothetical protein
VTGRAVTVALSANHPVSWPKAVECVERPELFFRPTRAGAYDAQQVCARCPMLQRCAEWALEAPQFSTDGVFASVPMPPIAPAYRKARTAALAQLRAVAATGIPAPEVSEQLLGAQFSDEIEEVA